MGHHRYLQDRLSGNLALVYETLDPLHVGCGVFEAASECGLAGGRTPVRGIVRRQVRICECVESEHRVPNR